MRVVTRANPGRVSNNAPTLPLIPSPAQAPSEEEAYEIPPTAFPRLLLRPLQVSFPIPFLPPPRPFSLSRHAVGFSRSSCKIRDDLTQATKRTCAHASSRRMTNRGEKKREIPRVEEEECRVLGLATLHVSERRRVDPNRQRHPEMMGRRSRVKEQSPRIFFEQYHSPPSKKKS